MEWIFLLIYKSKFTIQIYHHYINDRYNYNLIIMNVIQNKLKDIKIIENEND